ncbi:helix-turn-helix domain-containing protein [Chryseobacterium sp. VD8]|uniref:helix-turn-helix domain-containing protein n=1 Tax=Chryseobacterium sp. VD8 TaxID=3081254 RepID=UPI003019C129
MDRISPNYKRIYTDMITKKYPDKHEECLFLLSKKELSALDIIRLNDKLIKNYVSDEDKDNKKHRSYDKSSIFEILDYQVKNKLNNLQLAKHFKLSRNTIAKWKKLYYSKIK